MKAVILAGGRGMRLNDETQVMPKPMIDIGGKPILWHIMKVYAHYGICDFIVCCGYKGYLIKEYFDNYVLHNSDVTFDLASNKMQIHQQNAETWRVTLVDTGEQAMTGARLLAIKRYLTDGTFCMTYGDGVCNLDISATIQHHLSSGLLATVTAVHPPARFGSIRASENKVSQFNEKCDDSGWINGGFFILEPHVFDYVPKLDVMWEREPLENLAKSGQLGIFKHTGFWQCMDTARDKILLEELWRSGAAPWKIWA